MLNILKQIKNKSTDKSFSLTFLQIPISTKGFFQSKSSLLFPSFLFVLAKRRIKNFFEKKLKRIFFYSILFNSMITFKRNSMPLLIKNQLNWKKRILSLLKLYKKEKKYTGYALHSVKGGFKTSFFSFICFMPKSHLKNLFTNKKHKILRFKIYIKRLRFKLFNSKKLNFVVSSGKVDTKDSKTKKIDTKNSKTKKIKNQI